MTLATGYDANSSYCRRWPHSIQFMEPSEVGRLRQAAAQTFGGSPVLFAYLYGSKATGRDRPDSDTDVAVYVDPSSDFDSLWDALRVAGALETTAKLATVEVTVLNDAPLALAGRVLRDRIVIYSCDEPARVHYESLTFREFVDFDFHAKELDRELLKHIAEGRR